jgi:hypothetical protein
MEIRLAQWVKQNRLHFSILYILSALICLGWLIFGVIMAIHRPTDNSGDFFVLAEVSLICVVGLWVIYFAFIKLICHKPIIWIGIGIFVAMGLFPPWITAEGYFRGYMFVINNYSYLRVDISRLSVQWIIVAVITGGLFLTFQEKKKD